MSVTALRHKCAFLDRPCGVESDDVPLEVCRLCLDAWKASGGTIMVSRPLLAAEASRQPVGERAAEARPEAKPADEGSRGISEELAALDRLFFEGKMGVDEYLERRKRIVSSSAPSISWLKQMEERWLRGHAHPIPYTVLFEDGRPKAFYPEGWSPPEAVRRALRPLYEICSALGGGNIRLQAEGFKVEALGYRDGKLALLLYEEGQGSGDFEEAVEEARLRLRANSDWEEALKAFYDDRLRRRQSTYIL